MSPALLAVTGLEVAFPTEDGLVRAVDGISYGLAAGHTLGVVGESGSGKSVAALALLRLVPPPGRIAAGSVLLDGREITALDEAALQEMRGARIAMIFQEPMTALNPVFTVGDQIAESLIAHRDMSRRAAWSEAVALLDRVGIPAPAARAADYPHRLSGGMRQRAMIAIAIACRPSLLIADEPTTALDVTIQAQILDLLLDLQDEFGMAVQFISHNLAVVSEIADEIVVMYAGRIVERAAAGRLIAAPLHPYTQGLIAAVPQLAWGGERRPLRAIMGSMPGLRALPPGCRFSDRCPHADDRCRAAEPMLGDVGDGRLVACYKPGAPPT